MKFNDYFIFLIVALVIIVLFSSGTVSKPRIHKMDFYSLDCHDLQSIPGISAAIARKLINQRHIYGKTRFQAIKGIGPARAKLLEKHVDSHQ